MTITHRLPQPEGMGWQPGMGTKPQQFRASAVVAPAERMTRYWWTGGWWGDQRDTSECTIYSWLHALHDGPVTHPNASKPLANPTRLYQMGQRIDGTPTSDVHSGLTSDAAAQVMLRSGYIGEYRWALTLDEIIDCLINAGPGTIGTWWRSGMWETDSDGFISYSGNYEGGHQVVLDGVNRRTGIVRGKNSWGRRWGSRRGFFYLTFDDLAQMLDEGAEFCIARELIDRQTP